MREYQLLLLRLREQGRAAGCNDPRNPGAGGFEKIATRRSRGLNADGGLCLGHCDDPPAKFATS
jgi:hypothetical protein